MVRVHHDVAFAEENNQIAEGCQGLSTMGVPDYVLGDFKKLLGSETSTVIKDLARDTSKSLERLTRSLSSVASKMESKIETLHAENVRLKSQMRRGSSSSVAYPPPSSHVLPPQGTPYAWELDSEHEFLSEREPEFLASSWTSTRPVPGVGIEGTQVRFSSLPSGVSDMFQSQSESRRGSSDTRGDVSPATVLGMNGDASRNRRGASLDSLAAASTTPAAPAPQTTQAWALSGTSVKELRPKERPPAAIFVDTDRMKELVREAVMKNEYNVCDFYHKEGIAQAIARNSCFDLTTLFVIAFNAIWIAIDIDHNKAKLLKDAAPQYQVAEHLFCTYFATELCIRFAAFAHKWDCTKDSWFLFDAALVGIMVLETWVFSFVVLLLGTNDGTSGELGNATILRLLRFLKLARMARVLNLLRMMPEMMILIKAVSVAVRSVFFTLCLLLVVIYVFAITFTQLAAESSVSHTFPSVLDSMAFLLVHGMVPDISSVVYDLGREDMPLAFLFMLFILIATLTLMNMLVGVLVEVVSGAASAEKEQLTVQFVKTRLLDIMESNGVDSNGDNLISKKEFDTLILNPEAARMIQEIGVDVIGLIEFSDFLFKDDHQMTFVEFMDLVLQLRGSNTATVRDIVDMRKFVFSQLQGLRGDFGGKSERPQTEREVAAVAVTGLIRRQFGHTKMKRSGTVMIH